MSDNNLFDKVAVEKLKKLAEGIDFAMLATDLDSQPLHIIPMSTKKVDEDGNIWFLSGKDSKHNQNIGGKSKVHLIYCDKSSMQFLNIYGQARISTDKSVLRELYSSSDDAWFQGIDDPNLSAIQVRPDEVYYWDSKNGRLITLLKLGVSAITGDQPDILEHGKLQI